MKLTLPNLIADHVHVEKEYERMSGFMSGKIGFLSGLCLLCFVNLRTGVLNFKASCVAQVKGNICCLPGFTT